MNKAQEFIRIKRRKRKIKRLTMAAIILVIAIILFIYKAPIFNVKKIMFTGIKTVNENELQNVLKDYIGKNIFTINYKEVQGKLLENPYIKDVVVDKKGINTLDIGIEEGKVVYYIKVDETYKVITNDGFYVEKLETLEGKNLVNVTGVKDNGKEVGEKIIDDDNIIRTLNEFSSIIKSDLSELRIESLDLSDSINIKGYIKGVEVLFGNNENLLEKINKALNILEQSSIEEGYIDISFDGPPVVKIES